MFEFLRAIDWKLYLVANFFVIGLLIYIMCDLVISLKKRKQIIQRNNELLQKLSQLVLEVQAKRKMIEHLSKKEGDSK